MKCIRWRIPTGIIVACIFLSPSFTSAHEQMVLKVGGRDYFVRIGFANEPAFIGEPATLEFLMGPGTAPIPNSKAVGALPEGFRPSFLRTPELDAENNLSVELIAGAERRSLVIVIPFPPVRFAYQARFIPTGAGPYSFRFSGKVDGAPFSITASCVPGASHDEVAQLHPPQWGSEELPAGVIRSYKGGASWCPLARSEGEIPMLSVTGVSAGEPEGQTPQEKTSRVGEPLWPSFRTLVYGFGGLAAVGILIAVVVAIRRWRSRHNTPLY